MSSTQSSNVKDIICKENNDLPIGVAPNARFVSFVVSNSSKEPYNAEAVAVADVTLTL